jgi:hypothetical protein
MTVAIGQRERFSQRHERWCCAFLFLKLIHGRPDSMGALAS